MTKQNLFASTGARQTFLEQEAPQYLSLLQRGMAQERRDYAALMRAAHSLKGGAGTFQMPQVQILAHLLEDVLEVLTQGDLPSGEALLPQAVQELAWLLDNAGDAEITADPQLLAALQEAMAQAPAPSPEAELQAALEGTLEDCLQIAEARLEQGDVRALTELAESCALLAEELGLPWLTALIQPLQDQPLTVELGQSVLARIRLERDGMQQSLQQMVQLQDGAGSDGELTQAPATPVEEISSSLPLPTATIAPPEISGSGVNLVRLPLAVLNALVDTGGDTLLFLEKLIGQRDQMEAAIKRLKSLMIEFEPMRERLEDVYEQMALPYRSPTVDEFEGLELDRFTDLHENLQGYQELFAQVSESAEDLDLISRVLSRDLISLRRGLDRLYRTSTQARLIPFHTLVEPFYGRLERLSQRFGKQVELQVEGREVLLDRVLLEELRTPLTHLINNAFDHGLESPAERRSAGKSPTACITVSAQVEGNQVRIQVRDDGRGIPAQRVYEKAWDRGLTHQPLESLSEAQILNFLFQPGFSTTDQVSQLSGRGVGLDVVKTEVETLGGSVGVQTRWGQGTSFSLQLPLGVNLITVVVLRAQGQTLGLIREDVLDVVRQLPALPQSVMEWQGRLLPVRHLSAVLPFAQARDTGLPQAVVVVAGPDRKPLGILADEVLEPKQRIIKPLMDLFPLPAYVCGATLLPTGESAPVVLPGRFHLDLPEPGQVTTAEAQPVTTDTILVAEDSVSTRQLLQEVLTDAGYRVLPCRDGQEALDLLGQQGAQISLVLSDLDMPRVNGLELLRQIRSQREWSQIPVILLTSRTREQHRQKAAALGVSGYLSKPYKSEILLAEVQKWLPVPTP